ncbi:MAG: SPOR domain-containing protein [Sulfurovum sp.]|nr:SPOR domain-containing protein [Sulfurovum sp.]
MNDHNLDDLIIDDIQPNQSNKAKSFLTIIALAIVVLIVSIIFTKILLKDPKQDQLLFEQNETEIISPDLTLQSITEPEGETSEPLISSEEGDLLDISEETVSQKVTEEVPAPATKETTEISEAPQQAVAQKLEVETEKEPVPAGMPKAEEEKPTDILDTAEESVPLRTEPRTPEKSYQKTTPKPTGTTAQQPRPKPANPITRPHSKSSEGIQSGGYYIQVGAFSTVPSKRFLERISQNGFAYTITNKNPRGLRKLLIGPYQDRSSAERALVKVKDRINKNAFLLK